MIKVKNNVSNVLWKNPTFSYKYAGVLGTQKLFWFGSPYRIYGCIIACYFY